MRKPVNSPRSYPNPWLDSLRQRKALKQANSALSARTSDPDQPAAITVMLVEHCGVLTFLLYVLGAVEYRIVGYSSDPIETRAVVAKRLRWWHPLSWPVAMLGVMFVRPKHWRWAIRAAFAGNTHPVTIS